MAVYYKLKSEKNYYTLPIDSPAISVFDLKMKVVTSKRYGKGKDFDLILMNAQTNQEYTEDTSMIQTNTSILIRRVPGPPRRPIVIGGPEIAETDVVAPLVADFSTKGLPYEPDYDMGDDACFAHKKDPDEPTSHALSRSEEDRKIEALVNTPALEWSQTKKKNAYYSGGFHHPGGLHHPGGFTPKISHGRMTCNSGNGLVGFRKPPPSYICHRCKEPGHFIQHCPTNGDPRFDVKKLKKATGIPKSMLSISSDGSYSLPNGATAVLQPNEAAFDKAMEGITSAFDTTPTSDIPPEFKCPLCTQVMKDAVLSSKCCCASYCDKCIRDHIITEKMCMCGSRNVLADDLLPNKTIRKLIDSILMSKYTTSSSKKTGTSSSVTDIGSEKNVESRPKHIYDATEYTEKNSKEYASKLEADSEPTSIEKSVPRENAPVAQGVKRKMINEDKGTKKKKIQTTASTSESSISESGLASTCESSISQSNFASNEENFENMAFDDISASYYGGMPFTLPTYNPYWFSGGMPSSEYTASYPAGTPGMYYSANAYDAATRPILQHPGYPDRHQRH